MDTLELKEYGIKIGDGEKLVVMAGLNVLEDEGLAQEVCAELKAICDELDLPYVFKASWDKANRSSITSYRGPGMAEGLPILEAVKAKHGVPVVTICTNRRKPKPSPTLPKWFSFRLSSCGKPIWWSPRRAPLLPKAAGCMPRRRNSSRHGTAPISYQIARSRARCANHFVR